jgi:tetratricopeptide (TPR) repeat protein
LAYFVSRGGDEQTARSYLRQAAKIYRDFVFPSRTGALDVLSYAVRTNPSDAHAHLHLGNLFGNLGRLDEASSYWEKAARLDSSLSIPLRNLGLAAWARERDLGKAAAYYRKAIAARPQDQTLYRDLAEILVADKKRLEAIQVLESMQFEGQRRSDITIMLAEAYVAEERYTDAIDLLESTPYFVNWEGQDITRVLFAKAHLARGQQRFENGEFKPALDDFAAALTYPDNLGVGRTNRPQEARAEYWKGKALEALGRLDEARSAWKKGAAGHEGSDEQNEHRKLCKEALDRLDR